MIDTGDKKMTKEVKKYGAMSFKPVLKEFLIDSVEEA